MPVLIPLVDPQLQVLTYIERVKYKIIIRTSTDGPCTAAECNYKE